MVYVTKEMRVNSETKKNFYELIIKSDLNEIPKVERFTEKVSEKMNFTEEEKDSLAISITEIVSNAISHGNKKDKNKKVVIKYQLSPKSLTISVQDEGKGFDEKKIADPLDPKNLLKESGRGVYIVRTLMDKLEFEYNKTGTLTRIVKNKKHQ